MKKLIFLLVLSSAFVKAQVTFNNTYDAGTDLFFNAVEMDDGYLMAGNSSFPLYPEYLNVFKTDFNGQVQWTKVFGDSSFTIIYSLIKLSDVSLITGCYSYDASQDIRFLYLFKLTNNGDTVWTRKIFPPTGQDFYGTYMSLTSDGKLIISGQIGDNPSTDADGLLLMADTNGNYLWHKTFGGQDYDGFYSSVQLPDMSILSTGWSRSFGSGNGNRDVYLVKTDSAGNLIWQKTYGTTGFESSWGITKCSDGNFLISAFRDSNIQTLGKAWLLKIDTAGTIIWQNDYFIGQVTDILWAKELPNKNIIGIGSSETPQNIDDGLVICTDEHGYLKWHRTFPMNNDQAYFRDVISTSDGGFLCAGFCFTGASGNEDGWLVKIDSTGSDSAGAAVYHNNVPETPVAFKELRLYPNPASGILYFHINDSKYDYLDISIFDALGRKVLSKRLHDDKFPLDIQTIPQGIYFLKCLAGKKEYGGVFIKQ